ncbi:iron ABC transporter substrate-binding protein [Colwellia sp. MT41]|uniref:metal ABC transporter substrate-binding protein n=1 Tax=Colwellia sp. MT41 TaxID=58049 RepID=UPI00071759B4|nr:metal ABC transporter substrate-binding protein [Colwellia sp. MT41]ALO35090.1 iron ABC transporter substrate-binding protein [Colwellia sp. MT41]
MARIFYLLLLMILLTSTTMAMAEPTKKFKVLTSFTIIADIAKNIAGDVAQVESLTKVNAEIHNYQVTPSDIRRAVDADLLLYNGLNLERWFDKFLNNLAGVPREVISKNIIPLGIGLGPYKGKPNPHAWMSADNAIIYIDNVRAALVKHDPKNTATYNNNAKIYTAKLQAELAPLKQQLSRIPAEQRWLVTSEGAFSYLARDYQLKELYLWPINADAQGTPQQIRHVIDKINANNINTIFSESTVSAKPAQQVARATNIHYGGVLYVDSLSNKQGPVPSYIELLKVTLTTIHQGLLQQ